MKQALLLAVVFPGLSFTSDPAVSRSATHETRTGTDAAGRTYQWVTNDATGARIYTLPNGLQVYLAQNRDEPRVRVMLTVRAGAAFDPSDNTGLAHYLEHLLFNGTDSIGTVDRSREQPLLAAIERTLEARRSTADPAIRNTLSHRIDSLSVAASAFAVPDEYRALMSSIGAVAINGYTNYDLTAYWCLVPSPSLEPFLRLECERLRHPALRAFQHELEIVYQEFNEQQDHALRRKREAVHRQLFPRHPYGQQKIIGTAEHLRNPSIPAIRAFYERYYVPGNMALVLVGDLEFEATMDLVDATFGRMPARPVTRPELPKEVPMTTPRDTTIHGEEESVYIGFRFRGGNSTDVHYATLTDMVLNNGFAGLMDIELNGKQRVASAGTTVNVLAEHAIHYMEGRPKEGQSLDEVRDLLMQQLDRIARGDFEEWVMQGALNDLRKQEAQNFASSVNLSSEMMHAYYRKQSWAERIGFLDAIGQITKQQLMDFVRTRYTERSIVFMRKGAPEGLVRLEKPPIKPTEAPRDRSSVFATRFKATPPPGTQPAFVDYATAIQHTITGQGIDLAFVKNTSNDLFQMDVIFNMGSNHSRTLPLAIGYLPLLGTQDRSMEEFKKAFYRLGLQFTASCGTDRTYLHLEGLEEHAAEGMMLLDELLAGAKADTSAFRSYVDGLLKQRADQATDPNMILEPGLSEWALYGPRSPSRNLLPAAELRALDPRSLARDIHELRDFHHRIFYFGSDMDRAVRMLDSTYNARPHRSLPPAIIFSMNEGASKVYFVNRDAVQAEVMLMVPGPSFRTEHIASSNFFGPYFDHLLFERLRQAGAIAYNTSGGHQLPRDTTGRDLTLARFRTQPDKLPEALALVTSMLNELPGTAADVNYVRDDQLKRYGAERINGMDIFWTHERNMRRGSAEDPRIAQYAYVQQVDTAKLRTFFQEHIAGRPIHILVVGGRDHINMKALAAYGPIEEVDPKVLFEAP